MAVRDEPRGPSGIDARMIGEQLDQQRGAVSEHAKEKPGAETTERRGITSAEGFDDEQCRRAGDDGRDEELRQHERALPEVAALRLAEEERAVASRRSGEERGRQRESAQSTEVAARSDHEPRQRDDTIGEQDEGAPDEPRARIRLEQEEEEALGALEVQYQKARRDRQEDEREQGRDDSAEPGAAGALEAGLEEDAKRGDEEHARRDRLGPQIGRDLP